MNWDTYKLLDSESRLEWDFKFKDKVEWPSNNNGLLYTVLLWALAGVSAMAVLMIAKEYVNLSMDAFQMFKFGILCSVAMLSTWAIEYLARIGYWWYWKVQEQKWIESRVINNV